MKEAESLGNTEIFSSPFSLQHHIGNWLCLLKDLSKKENDHNKRAARASILGRRSAGNCKRPKSPPRFKVQVINKTSDVVLLTTLLIFLITGSGSGGPPRKLWIRTAENKPALSLHFQKNWVTREDTPIPTPRCSKNILSVALWRCPGLAHSTSQHQPKNNSSAARPAFDLQCTGISESPCLISRSAEQSHAPFPSRISPSKCSSYLFLSFLHNFPFGIKITKSFSPD